MSKTDINSGNAFSEDGMKLAEALSLSPGEVVALVGGGGKTAALYTLARELSQEGRKVVITTTTKLWPPSPEEASCLVMEGRIEGLVQALEECLKTWPVVVAARGWNQEGKLLGLPAEEVGELLTNHISHVLVEADGSAGRPFKAPLSYEPVFPVPCHLVVPVVGVDVLGQPLSPKWVHRPERVAALTGLRPGEAVSAKAVARVMTHPEGSLRGMPRGPRVVPLLNKVDDPSLLVGARELAALLLRHFPRVVLASLKAEPPLVEVMEA